MTTFIIISILVLICVGSFMTNTQKKDVQKKVKSTVTDTKALTVAKDLTLGSVGYGMINVYCNNGN